MLRLFLTAIFFAAGCAATGAKPPQLRYVVIISRHGARSPTWDAVRLNQYAAEPWPEWGVPAGNLTPHGRTLTNILGAYYREWLSSEHLLGGQGCEDAQRVYIHADTDQRTLETGRAFAESLLAGCPVVVHSEPQGRRDPLFDPISAGVATPDWETAAKAVRERLGDRPESFLNAHRGALQTLQALLDGVGSAPHRLIPAPARTTISLTGKSLEINEPWRAAATISENLLLEFANGMQGQNLGWGRLDSGLLQRALELHAAYADLFRRTPYLARASGSNLLDHVLRSIEQAVTRKEVPGALGHPSAAVLILVGHDTNLSNLSGMLDLSWHLPGYPRDEAPPGAALIFSLWQQPDTAKYFVRSRYVVQTLEQMRAAMPLTLTTGPAAQDLLVAGCPSATPYMSCPWETFAAALRSAIDEPFVSPKTAAANPPAPRQLWRQSAATN